MPAELQYAARSRCLCGHGLVYVAATASWDCSGLVTKAVARDARWHYPSAPAELFRIEVEHGRGRRAVTTRQPGRPYLGSSVRGDR